MNTKQQFDLLRLVGAPPLVDKHTIPVNIKLYITTVDGATLDKADPSIPAAMKQKYPFYLFGEFDKQGGFRVGNRVNPAVGCDYIFTYVNGMGVPFLSFSGLNFIQNNLQLGDMVHIFADDKFNPNFFAFVVVANTSASYASIIQNSETVQDDKRIGQVDLYGFNYSIVAPGGDVFIISRQLQEDFKYVFMDNIGMFKNDSIQPGTYKTPYNQIEDVIFMALGFKMDQYFMLSSYIDYEVDSLQLNFNVNK